MFPNDQTLSQGPHIASVTLAAYECGSTDFPEPPYPDQIICPEEGGVEASISIFSIMSKVRLEACMWVSGGNMEKSWRKTAAGLTVKVVKSVN